MRESGQVSSGRVVPNASDKQIRCLTMGSVMADKIQEPPRIPKIPKEDPPAHSRRRSHWVWPLGLALAGLGSAAAFILRGCWHKDIGWPTKHDDEFSYQVCLGCGIKRLVETHSICL